MIRLQKMIFGYFVLLLAFTIVSACSNELATGPKATGSSPVVENTENTNDQTQVDLDTIYPYRDVCYKAADYAMVNIALVNSCFYTVKNKITSINDLWNDGSSSGKQCVPYACALFKAVEDGKIANLETMQRSCASDITNKTGCEKLFVFLRTTHLLLNN